MTTTTALHTAAAAGVPSAQLVLQEAAAHGWTVHATDPAGYYLVREGRDVILTRGAETVAVTLTTGGAVYSATWGDGAHAHTRRVATLAARLLPAEPVVEPGAVEAFHRAADALDGADLTELVEDTASTLALATGSTAVTVRHERRAADGTLVVEGEGAAGPELARDAAHADARARVLDALQAEAWEAHADLARLQRAVEVATARRRAAVQALRTAGVSTGAVAALLGMSQPRVVQVAQGQAGGRKRPAEPVVEDAPAPEPQAAQEAPEPVVEAPATTTRVRTLTPDNLAALRTYADAVQLVDTGATYAVLAGPPGEALERLERVMAEVMARHGGRGGQRPALVAVRGKLRRAVEGDLRHVTVQ